MNANASNFKSLILKLLMNIYFIQRYYVCNDVKNDSIFHELIKANALILTYTFKSTCRI